MENISLTKIKRYLAKKGIGSPLNSLVYTEDEAKEMKRQGFILDKKNGTIYNKRVKRKKRVNHSKTDIEDRIVKMAQLWCKWNASELNDDDFAYQFGNVFEKQCLIEWRKRIKLKTPTPDTGGA